MKIGYKFCLSLLLITIILASCEPKYFYIKPPGNLNKLMSKKDSVNTAKEEIAPVQIPSGNYSSPYGREFGYEPDANSVFSSRVLAKKDYFREADEKTLEYLTNNTESLSFIDDKSAFIALSHIPDSRYASKQGIPVMPVGGTIAGGTDILEYNAQAEEKFLVLDDKINSPFWDSHPFAIDTVIGDTTYTMLLWSSDRDAPYLKRVALNSKEIMEKGSTDIYYSFRKKAKSDKNAPWQEARKIGGDVSLAGFNEGSPFVFCFCYNPNLFFSSNRNNTDSNDFDIYSAKLKIDFENLTIEPDGKAEMLGKQPKYLTNSSRDSSINSFSDDRFPFIASPFGDPSKRYIYFSSNRNSNRDVTYARVRPESDTLMLNAGSYDLYRFPLPNNANYRCEPPPPPKLFLLVHVHRTIINAEGDTVGNETDFPGASYLFNSETKPANQRFEIYLNSSYTIRGIIPAEDCYQGDCQTIEFRSPSRITKDSTIELTINCIARKRPATYNKFSYSQGIAFFITGYWWPTTSDNLSTFWTRWNGKNLASSKFIDPEDYKSDGGEYYNDVAKMNDAFMDELYERIDSVLAVMDDCYGNQKLIITTHGYTDPCPLRRVMDEKGTLTEDYTVYSCDDTIAFNDVLIPPNTKMKNPNLLYKSGKPFRPPLGVQQGNYILAMLRAYYTGKTIEDGFKKKFSNKSKDIDKFDKFVEFKYDAFGIYNERPPCPNIDKKIIGVNLMNKRYPPDNVEPCNLPHSRRVMIYIDIVNNEVINTYKVDECGGRRSERLKIEGPTVEEPIVIKDTVRLDFTKEMSKEVPNSNQSTCAGPECYRVSFGAVENADDFNLLKGIIESMGFSILAPADDKDLELRSASTFATQEDAKKFIEEFKSKFKKLDGLVKFKISDFKAKVKHIGL